MHRFRRAVDHLPAAIGEIRRGAGFPVAAAFLVLALPFYTQLRAQEPAAPAEPAGPATYAGDEICQACHEDIFKAFERNPHRVLERVKARGWEGRNCESCHGPGSKHAESVSAEDIQNPARLPASRASEICLKCHLQQPFQVSRNHSPHARNGVSCAGCHSIHKPGPGGAPAGFAPRKPAAVNAQCMECHTAAWAQFQRPHAHRLAQGAMSCTDCHNPHGSLLANSIKAVRGNEPACLGCHGDKRGPFVFEHAPVRLEGCGSCHEPHGSANPKMLTRAQVHLVCLECHSNLPTAGAGARGAMGGIPPAIHDLRTARYRNCTLCHVKVHGSHVNRALLR